MTIPSRVDVLVVGAGPAGVAAAVRLSQCGIQPLVVDRATFPRDKVCGESVSPGAIEGLRRLGLWSGAMERSATISGMRVTAPGGTTFRGSYRRGAGGGGRGIERSQLDAALLAGLRSAGVKVIEGVEAVSTRLTSDGGTVNLREPGASTTISVEARRIVVADGRRSFLARECGLLTRRHAGDYRYAVRAHFEGVAALSSLGEMFVAGGGYCGVAPVSATRANVCAVVFSKRLELRPRMGRGEFLDLLRPYSEIHERLANAHMADAVRVIGPLRLRSARRAAGPYIACGDTAGFLDPFTGEGIAHAVNTGALAAEAIRDDFGGDHGAFRRYDKETGRLRREKDRVARLLYFVVKYPSVANGAAGFLARLPSLANAAVRLFGDER